MNFKEIDINNVVFDLDNPRIVNELSVWPIDEHQSKAEGILWQAENDEPGPGCNELARSIQASNGILDPIIVVPAENGFKCIEGNTRLAIYKKFSRDDPENQTWHKIKSLIHDTEDPSFIESLRLQAHFIGKKQWSLYAKGSYINKLKANGKSDQDIISILGGNSSDIFRLNKAFNEFEFYKSLHSENEVVDEYKFSHFKEGASKSVEQALESHFGNYEDAKKEFAKMVYKKKFQGAVSGVRKIPSVFANEIARNAFLSGDVATMEEASSLLPRTGDNNVKLLDASLEELSTELNKRISGLDRQTMGMLKAGSMEPTRDSLNLLQLDLTDFLDELE
ncbi:ParB/Srx family N-terminal domain-containing protein [Gammaproteobacteria bacterium]|nr:ParB/Srx family N-terminal domain-containing protein [Gammaproteobacteria bacterium]